MLTGSNFKRASSSMTGINRLEEKLEEARVRFSEYAKTAGEEDFTFDTLRKMENEIERLEYDIYCERYEDERKRTCK